MRSKIVEKRNLEEPTEKNILRASILELRVEDVPVTPVTWSVGISPKRVT